MKLAIVGSRDITNYPFFKQKVDSILESMDSPIDVIVSGGAQGVDSMAERYAKEKNIPTQIFKPDWAKFGKAAGPIRNRTIVENSDMIIAFPIEGSRGTQSTIDIANEMGKKVTIIHS